MVRDPSWIFVYWTLAEPDRLRAEGLAGGPWEWVLRLYHLRRGDVEDLPLDPAAKNWYVPVEPGASYEVELGVRNGGVYHAVLCGNAVTLPPLTVSPLVDPHWFISEAALLRLAGGGHLPGAPSSGALPTAPERAVVTPPEAWPLSELVSSHDAQKKPQG